MRILVTGSDGKVGKELMKLLGEHEVYPIDKRGGASYKVNLATDPLGSIYDFKPEVIVHLAASFERTDETPQFHAINFEDNILATYRLNETIAKLGYCPRAYIFASSYLVYDPLLYLADVPLKEARVLSEVDELSPRNLIGAAKLYAEKEIDFIKRNVHPKMKVAHARIFRVFGEGGQEFVSRLIEWKAIGLKVDVWKVENSFDYIHTSDCAAALKAMIDRELDGVYNVGSGKTTSIGQIVRAINPEIRRIGMNDQYEQTVASIERMMEDTTWMPKVDVIDWIKGKMK